MEDDGFDSTAKAQGMLGNVMEGEGRRRSDDLGGLKMEVVDIEVGLRVGRDGEVSVWESE